MSSTLKRVLTGIWLVFFVAGAVGIVLRLLTGERLTDFGSYIPWGLWVAVYAWFVGLSAGAFMLFAAGQLFEVERLRRVGRPALVVALASLLSGLVVVGLDLGHWERFWHVYVYGNPISLMAWEISFYTAFGALLTVTFVIAFRNEIAGFAERPGALGKIARGLRLGKLAGRSGEETGWLPALALVGGVLAVIVCGATGALFGIVGARPFWHTGLLPILFIAVALLSAAAVLTVVAAFEGDASGGRTRRSEVAALGRLTLALLGVVALILWADISVAFAAQNLPGWEAYDVALSGPYWWVFWLVQIGAGIVVPAAILVLRPRSVGWVAAAAGLVAVSLVALRLNTIIPGLALPQIEGLDEAFREEGLTLSYAPTLNEWLVAIFSGALFVGLLAGWALLSPIRFEEPAAAAAGGAPVGGQTRGAFLGKAGIAGGAVLASQLPLALHLVNDPGDGDDSPLGAETYALATPENVLYSVCQQCNTQCGIKAKVVDGVVVKIDGNPYSPWTMFPPVPYGTPVERVTAVDGYLCPKGQAGIQTLYDPYRIRKVLKRVGPRGGGEWQTIEFDRAVREIVEGGELFEGEAPVAGLAELWALRDPDVAKELGDAVKEIWDGKLTVSDFKREHAQYLDLLIDPDHPDLGPKNNQVVFAWGRLKSGRSELLKRFISESFGSANAHGHTTVCQGSLYFGGKAMSEQYVDGKWQGGTKAYWQADVAGSEFAIFVGASPFEANYGPPYRTQAITNGISEGRLKIAVVDPRLSKTASKAWKWLPAQPGSEGALALAMIGWILENDRFDRAFLANANKAAAEAGGESTWTNASWLVHTGGEHEGMLVRASEIGLRDVEIRQDAKGEDYEFDYFVALRDGKPVPVDPGDEENAIVGDLLVSTTVGGLRVKSGLQLLREAATERTLAEWAELAGIGEDDIVELAREFTSHGKRAVADIHRGVSQHTNGYYNVVAWNSLNALVGNYDWKGGMCRASTYSVTGDKDGEPMEGKPFVLVDLHPAKVKPFGVSSIRHETPYEKTTIFADYPAKRPWFPLSSDVYQEIIPSIGDAYPYPIKALFLYMGTPVYALPAGHVNIEVLSDTQRLPLFVASDITIGETSMYADYIFPDATYLERWEFAGSHPSVTYKVMPVRQPVVAPLTDHVTVFGETQPITFESMLLGLAGELGLPGFGPDGLAPGRPLSRPEDFYLLMAANVAAGDKEDPVPDASAEEIELFVASRRHLPPEVFDAERWRRIVGADWWPKVVYILNRGGRFADAGWDGDLLANRYGKQLNLYQEKTAKAVNAMTGEHYAGVPRFVPAPLSSVGEPVADGDFPLRLITFREITHTKSRTIGNYWLLANLPENTLLLNTTTAGELGYDDGDWARLVSATNPEGVWPLGNGRTWPMVAKVRTTEGLRPGVVAFSLGHGHWAYGASDVVIDGDTVKADERRRAGFHGNAAMRVDPHLGNVCLSDLTGGSAVFYDTSVRLEPASADEAAHVISV